MERDDMTWDIDGMHIHIYEGSEHVMTIFLGEVMEATHRFLVESHIKEIDNSPWIKNWHDLDEWNRDSI